MIAKYDKTTFYLGSAFCWSPTGLLVATVWASGGVQPPTKHLDTILWTP